MIFIPFQTKAGFLSSLLGTDASADSIEIISGQLTTNSQNMTLLEANVSAVSFDSKDSKKEIKGDNKVNDKIDVSITGNALVPATSPLGVSDGTDYEDPSFDQVNVYVVRKGDSIPAIAKMFGVSVNTIYWANDLKKGDKLKEGDTLVILPFDGLTHTVKAKETLAGIAKLYKADMDDIIAFNGLSKEDGLTVGDELVIPEGQKIEENDKPVKNPSVNPSKNKNYAKNLKSVDGYFIYPLPKGPRIRKTQGLHDGYAVDIGAPAGTPIYAVAEGTVVVARNGYNGGYGNFVIIKHPNGTESRYGHMSRLGTTAGKQVSQGEVIGYVGTTGRSTGNHLHVEIRGAKNPF